MTGDLAYFRPGEELSATLHANADGTVPERGDALEVTGENASGAEVSGLTDPANFVATLVDRPADFNEEDAAGFVGGEEVGTVTVRVTHHAEWVKEATPGTITPGDFVVMGADGARVYDPTAAPGAEDTPLDVVGLCWLTAQKDEGTTDKVVVVRSGK